MMAAPTPRAPTEAEFHAMARHFGLNFSEGEAAEHLILLQRAMKLYARLDELPEPATEARRVA